MTNQNLPDGQLPSKQSEGIGIDDLHALDQMVRPYFEGHWKSQLEQSKIETAFELKVAELEFKFRKWMMIGIFSGILVVLVLTFYLFATGRDNYAMQIVVGVVLVVMTFLAGYSLNPSRRSMTSEE